MAVGRAYLSDESGHFPICGSCPSAATDPRFLSLMRRIVLKLFALTSVQNSMGIRLGSNEYMEWINP